MTMSTRTTTAMITTTTTETTTMTMMIISTTTTTTMSSTTTMIITSAIITTTIVMMIMTTTTTTTMIIRIIKEIKERARIFLLAPYHYKKKLGERLLKNILDKGAEDFNLIISPSISRSESNHRNTSNFLLIKL